MITEISAQQTVSTIVKLPEALQEPIARFLDANPDWSFDRVMTAAACLFLMQNSPAPELQAPTLSADSYRRATRTYLTCLFDEKKKQAKWPDSIERFHSDGGAV